MMFAQVKLDQTTGLLRQNRPEGSEGPPEESPPLYITLD